MNMKRILPASVLGIAIVCYAGYLTGYYTAHDPYIAYEKGDTKAESTVCVPTSADDACQVTAWKSPRDCAVAMWEAARMYQLLAASGLLSHEGVIQAGCAKRYIVSPPRRQESGNNI